MKNRRITEKSRKIVNELINNVGNMTEAEFKSIAESMARFYNYSFYNQFILYCSGASQVASYKRWKEMGRSVKNGAKAIWILAPSIKKVREENEETGEDEIGEVITGFVSVPVFDIADTEGEEIKRKMTTKSDIELDTLLKVAENLGYKVSFKALEVETGGYVAEKNIVLNSNLPKLENTGTMLHELSHGELGHTNSSDMTSRSLAEQQAETVTAILCNIYGIERKSDFYLKSWKLDEDIKKSFAEINKAVFRITNQVEELKK